MNKCLECGTETNNPKFCGMSCAGKFNNKLFKKRNKKIKICKNCNKEFTTGKSNAIFCSNVCSGAGRRIEAYQLIEKRGAFDIKSNKNPHAKSVRKYCVERYGNKCSLCGLDASSWNGQSLVLIVDHIDGHSNNWTLDNIRLVCPNCDTQLPTFKGRNKGNSTRKYTITQRQP